jgi:molybdopterin synthase sulfur carrier subunit
LFFEGEGNKLAVLNRRFMPVTIRIPPPLRTLTAGKGEVQLSSDTVRQLVDHLEERHQGLKARLCDSSGELHRFLNVFVNEDEIRELQGLETLLKDGDVVAIIPAIAGGR